MGFVHGVRMGNLPDFQRMDFHVQAGVDVHHGRI
jgi:hypothetical protein